MNRSAENESLEYRDKILNKINELIEFGKQEGERLQKNNLQCSMDTPYECHMRTTDYKRVPQPIKTEPEGLKDFAKKIFRHYDVNPSIKEYGDKITNTYVTENLNVISQLKESGDIVNENGVNLKFYSEIKNTIKKIKVKDNSLHSEDKTIYITGIRGSGKTAFFNYFISRYEYELNEDNIISVRINVMKIFGPATTLDEAIQFKLCRILFTYYCSWSKSFKRLKGRDIRSDIDPILHKLFNKFKELDVVNCHKYFCDYNSKKLISIPSEYSKICKELLQEMIQEYKFIIILDNFDQLNPNDRSKNEYQNRRDELDKIDTKPIFDQSLFLIAVRYSTYKRLIPSSTHPPKCWVIGSPSTYRMIKKRLDYHINVQNPTDKESNKQKEEYITHIIRLIGSSFIPEYKELSFEEACEEIDSIYAGNKRIILNIIDKFIDSIFGTTDTILSNTSLARNVYKYFESLFINPDTGYCNIFYEYTLKNDNTLKFGNINASAHYDNSYIPNIYRFPSVIGINTMVFTPFMKIRILQLLNRHNNLTTRKVTEILNKIFSYGKDAIKLACVELREDQSLILRNGRYEPSDEDDETIENIPMEITDRGRKLLKILPINVNLLAVCLEHIFFPEDFLKTGIPIGNYYSEFNIGPSHFIIKNIFCSIPKIIGLFINIEQSEKNKFENIQQEFKCYYNQDEDFSFAKKLEEQARDSISKILKSYFTNPAGSNSEQEPIYINRRSELDCQLQKMIPNEQMD